MACPTCDHMMSHLGETLDGPSRRAIWWCLRCGTIRVDGFGSFDQAPKLVAACRQFRGLGLSSGGDKSAREWHRLGIEESILPPDRRLEIVRS